MFRRTERDFRREVPAFFSLFALFLLLFIFFFFYFHREIVRNIQRETLGIAISAHGEVIAAVNDCFPVCLFLITLFSSTVTRGLIRFLIDTSSRSARAVFRVFVCYISELYVIIRKQAKRSLRFRWNI